MKADGGLVEDVEDAAEVRAKLGGEADALRFAAAQGLGGAIQGEVIEADAGHEFQALADLREDIGGDDAVRFFKA